MHSIDFTKRILIELLQRIKFLERSEANGLIIAAEEQLAMRFDFQVTNHICSSNYWDYYIRCSLRYSDLPRPMYQDRLRTLIANIEFLLEHN